MSKISRPRKGSLQFWPRKRARKILHSVNWRPVISAPNSFLGFIAYKVGMASAIVKDLTEKSLTEKKQITIPITILEAPNMKLFSIRFYKNSKVLKDVIISDDKDLKKKVKLPKILKELNKEIPEDYDDVHIIAYSLPKQTSIKKTPDLIELAVASDTPQNKLEFIKNFVNKEISLSNILVPELKLLDIHGLTKGKGTQGPVKRFGISLKPHKTEKGIRRPGSLAPWHPARVTFHTAMMGQLGFFSRVTNNLKVISHNKISDKNINPEHGFKNYGKIKTSYILLNGSVQGPAKRQLILTPSIKPTKSQLKKKYELAEVITK